MDDIRETNLSPKDREFLESLKEKNSFEYFNLFGIPAHKKKRTVRAVIDIVALTFGVFLIAYFLRNPADFMSTIEHEMANIGKMIEYSTPNIKKMVEHPTPSMEFLASFFHWGLLGLGVWVWFWIKRKNHEIINQDLNEDCKQIFTATLDLNNGMVQKIVRMSRAGRMVMPEGRFIFKTGTRKIYLSYRGKTFDSRTPPLEALLYSEGKKFQIEWTKPGNIILSITPENSPS